MLGLVSLVGFLGTAIADLCTTELLAAEDSTLNLSNVELFSCFISERASAPDTLTAVKAVSCLDWRYFSYLFITFRKWELCSEKDCSSIEVTIPVEAPPEE